MPSLVVQWLRLRALNAEGMGSIPGWGTKNPHAMRPKSENLFFRLSQVALAGKNSPARAGEIRDVGLISGFERSPEGGNGNPLQYYCLEHSIEKPGRLQSMGSPRVRHD